MDPVPAALRVGYLAAGSGSRWCGACVYSAELVRGLRQIGVEAVLVPTYLPLATEGVPGPRLPVFFGGISVFLEQYVLIFRYTPAWLDRLWDNRILLGLVGRLSRATRPHSLGPLTLSMLAGHEGRQRKEVDKLLRFLERELRPQIVHLSTGLLVGVARAVQEQLGVPVVATMAGEDGFIDGLPEPYRSQARQLAAERLRELPALVALSTYYRSRVVDYFGVPAGKVWVIPPGVAPAATCRQAETSSQQARRRTEPCVGYLGRICPEKGFPIFAEALLLLKRGVQGELPLVRIAGQVDPSFRRQFGALMRGLAREGISAEYLGVVSPFAKGDFFGSVDLLVVPSTIPEPKAVTAIEAVVHGVPVIAPGHGALLEIVGRSGLGELYWPNTPSQLASVLGRWCRELSGRRRTTEEGNVDRSPRSRGADSAQGLMAENPTGGGESSPGGTLFVTGELAGDLADNPSLELPQRGDYYPPMVGRLAGFYRAERMARQVVALYHRVLAPAAYGIR